MKLVTEDYETPEGLVETQSKLHHDECMAYLVQRLEEFDTQGYHLDGIALVVSYANGRSSGGSSLVTGAPVRGRLLLQLERIKNLIVMGR